MPRSHIDRFVLAILVTASATILVFISRNGYKLPTGSGLPKRRV